MSTIIAHRLRHRASSNTHLRQFSNAFSNQSLINLASEKKDETRSRAVPPFLRIPTNNGHHRLRNDQSILRCKIPLTRREHNQSSQQYHTLSQSSSNPRPSSHPLTGPPRNRSISIPPELVPPFLENFTIWGGSGLLLNGLHMNGTVPYWACMSLTATIVRVSLFPLVIKGAHAAGRFASVAPEVQFFISNFMNDRAKLNKSGAHGMEKAAHMRLSLDALRGIYKYYDINPLDILKSPLLQIPCFWYFAIDIRKIIRGYDPDLARELSEGGVLWFPDLTDPDPWFVLPILSGALLYANVEYAMGKRNLAGEATGRANFAIYMKDFFQSLSVMIPCFMATSPAGTQIYLATSFLFTLGQSAALRNEGFRGMVGLPSLAAAPLEPELAKGYMSLMDKQMEAVRARGEAPVMGEGVLAPGWSASFEGQKRVSSIKPIGNKSKKTNMAFPGSSANPRMMVSNDDADGLKNPSILNVPFEVMDAANKGAQLPPPIVMATNVREEKANTPNDERIAETLKKGKRKKK